MKNLNLKRMATDMNFQDKMKIIFANWNHERESKERLITVQEEEAMIEDIQKKSQIKEYNRLIGLYNISNLVVLDIQTSTLRLELAISRAQTLILGMCLHAQSHDEIERILVSVRNLKSSKEEKKINPRNERNELFDYFQSQGEPLEGREPNHHIQMVFEQVIQANKVLRQGLHALDYILEKSGIDFIGKMQKEIVQKAQDELKYMEDLEGLLDILKIYKKAFELDLLRKNNFHKPSFLELILDHKKVLHLSDQEKHEAECEIEKCISKHN